MSFVSGLDAPTSLANFCLSQHFSVWKIALRGFDFAEFFKFVFYFINFNFFLFCFCFIYVLLLLFLISLFVCSRLRIGET